MTKDIAARPQHRIRQSAGCFLAVLCLAASVSLEAQSPCYPFSKLGMKRVNWKPGVALTLGNVSAGAAAIALTFEHDATFGIALTRIGHRGTRPDGKVARFTYSTVPPNNQPNYLWKAVLRPLGSTTPAELTPAAATQFSLFVDSTSHPRHAVFRWTDCCVPKHSAKSFFWFEMRVRISLFNPNRSSWSMRMARHENPQGTVPFTIDEIHAPIVHAQQPGDSQLARILVPAALNVPLPSQNLSMRTWQLFNLKASLQHPARGQQMQFSALYAGDPTELPLGDEVVSAHRKVLYFSTEDTQGHFKFFNHEVVADASTSAYRWNPVYYPAYGPSPRLNNFASPYPTVICALQAKSSAYWYDVTSHYRDFVRWRMRLIPIRSRLYGGNPDIVRESVLVATSALPTIHGDLSDVFKTFVDMGEHHQAVFQSPGTSRPSPFFMEWQKWLKAGGSAIEDPIGPGLNPRPFSNIDFTPQEPTDSARAQITRAHGLGMNVSVYTLPLIINTTDWSSFDQSWLLRDRLGNLLAEEDGHIVDFGAREAGPWFASVLYDDILNSTPALGGFFLDTIGGRGSFLRYPDPKSKLFNFKYHGGTSYVTGAKRMIDMVRQRVAKDKSTRRHPDIPFIPTEAVQEFYAGHYDIAQHGLKPLPFQAQLSVFIDQLTSPGSTPAPIEASTCNPPLWNAVYHEYSRAEALGMMLSTRAVSSLLGGGQPVDFNTGKFGLTWEQWGDYNRVVHATMFMQGMKPMLFSYFYDFKDLSLLVDNNGSVGVRNPAVPQQGQLLAFMQRLHGAVSRHGEAGQFLNYGVIERPLALPPMSLAGYNPLVVTTNINPSVAAMQRTDPLPGVTQHFYEDLFTQFPYPVASVLHSVWRRSPHSLELGLVFVNWTDHPAAWTGTFAPKLYPGFGSKFEVIGLRPDGAGVDSYTIGSGDGETAVRWGPAGAGMALRHHSAAAPNFMPPRSVQVVLIRPKR